MRSGPVAAQRVLEGATAELEVTLRDQDGEAADAAGVVTVGVVRADGTEVLPTGSSTTDEPETGAYSRTLTPAQTAELGMLEATWVDDADDSAHVTQHEIVGGFYFSVVDARAFDSTLEDGAKYPAAKIRGARTEVEEQFELITGVAFVRRYRRERLDGTGCTTLLLPNLIVRSVRSVRVYNGTTFEAFTVDELAAVTVSESGLITRTDGTVFTCGQQNIVVEYEHGFERPPADLRHQAMLYTRHVLNMEYSPGAAQQADSFTFGEGGVFRLAVPGRGGYETGIPSVDAVLTRYTSHTPGIA